MRDHRLPRSPHPSVVLSCALLVQLACTVETSPRTPVAAIAITPESTSVEAGGEASTVRLAATLEDARGRPLTGRPVTWGTSDPAVATVTGDGLVTGVTSGSVTVTAASDGKSASATVVVTPRTPRFGHVFVLVEENKEASNVIGRKTAPYLNSLATRYGLATAYHANAHPSIGNYFMLTVGKLVTNNDGYKGTVTDDNIVRRLLAAGKTWKSYAEDLPEVGWLGNQDSLYVRRHNPFAYLSDVVEDSVQRQNLVPFTQLAIDLANDALPDYAFIVPNKCHDAHDCPLATADAWLEQNIDPLIKSATFRRDGLLIITFDEAETDDTVGGGGPVYWVAVSSRTRPGHKSARWFQHQSTLRLALRALGLTSYPGAAAHAAGMGEFFTP